MHISRVRDDTHEPLNFIHINMVYNRSGRFVLEKTTFWIWITCIYITMPLSTFTFGFA